MIGCNPNEVELGANEELHDLQINNLYLVQRRGGYMFTSDSVLLANFVKLKSTDCAVELCAGSGVVSVLAASKNKYKKLVAVELQKSLFELCEKNFEINHIQNASCINLPLQNVHKTIGQENWDVVFCNPPFFKPQVLSAKTDERAIARKEIALNLTELIEEVSRLLKFGGSVYMVYFAERLAEVVFELKKHNLEPKILQFVQPKADREANIFLIKATKGGRGGIKVLPALVMYTPQGEETTQLKEIYNRKQK